MSSQKQGRQCKKSGHEQFFRKDKTWKGTGMGTEEIYIL